MLIMEFANPCSGPQPAGVTAEIGAKVLQLHPCACTATTWMGMGHPYLLVHCGGQQG